MNAKMKTVLACRGCGRTLLSENTTLADGCACNSERGINHGIVPPDVCTCTVCDPEQTGSSRRRPKFLAREGTGTPLVCHVCWPTRENWNAPCVHAAKANIRGRWSELQYNWASKVLDEMGVPGIVALPGEPVPGMVVASRLQWLAWALGAYGHERIQRLRKESDDVADQMRKAAEELDAFGRDTQ